MNPGTLNRDRMLKLLEQGCFTSHLLSFDNNKELKVSIGYAKQFVQVCRIHNQSTILKDSDWTSSRAKEFNWSLKHLEEWVWRTASKECVWRNESEEELLKIRHQKQEHQKRWSSEAYLARSYFTRVDKGHRTKCTTTNSATTFSAIFVSTTRQR